MVIGFLVAVSLALLVFSHYLNNVIPPEVSPAAARATQARIAPAGDVYAGATGAAAQAAAEAAATASAAAQVAYGGTMDGSVIFNNLCTGCHTSGVGNAPTMNQADWTARIAQGTETRYKHAIAGYTGPGGGIMPPKGGNPALTDEQMKATVDWMLANLK